MDAIGNLRSLLGTGNQPRRVLIGSHLDSVPNAGRYDGVLGVAIALAIANAIHDVDLPFDLEIVGFSEEEGVRFRKPFLGSMALAGRFDRDLLQLRDPNGTTLRSAIEEFGLDPMSLASAQADPRSIAYFEFHIEQGPVLDAAGESIAVVSAIAGQSRLEIVFTGEANHAGTTPMELRRDALAGASEWLVHVELRARSIAGLVATAGRMEVSPGAGNVIPGRVVVSLDVRHASDRTRIKAVDDFCSLATQVASRRGLQVSVTEQLNQSAVSMDSNLIRCTEEAILQVGGKPRRMVSGAGHDAMIVAERIPSAMIFIRSIRGISHHPDEAVHVDDVEKAIRAGWFLMAGLANKERRLA
jgi:allantoate deiminase